MPYYRRIRDLREDKDLSQAKMGEIEMKKAILAVTLCILLLCITACGNTNRNDPALGNTIKFAGNEEMLKHLEGMWEVNESVNEKEPLNVQAIKQISGHQAYSKRK